jgi:hypothetical protein
MACHENYHRPRRDRCTTEMRIYLDRLGQVPEFDMDERMRRWRKVLAIVMKGQIEGQWLHPQKEKDERHDP